MKKPVIQSVDFAEEWIVPRYAIDMYQLLAISLIRLRMFVITVRIKSFATKISIFLDYLETGLGIDVFRRLFPVILTDNGSEFKKVDELELTLDEDGFLVYRTSLYYCDPMASWQKGCIEKNHEFIRYAVPKGKSLNPYTQEDMTLLMNHINSVKRPGLGNKSPYELVEEDDEDFKALMSLLKMHLIPPDEVHLMPDLFVKK